MLPQVEYLGHQISAKGFQPTEGKVRAITDAPTPKDVTQLKSYLGLLNYYGKFLPDLATRLAPLYELLQKHKKWAWGEEQEKAFQVSKAMLTSSSLLTHYDGRKELILACDASPYGVGAVLSHQMDDGTEQPVAFASRSLSQAKRNYAQLDKKTLAIIFGVKRFHPYLFGRKFTIFSDHQPLKYLFSENRGIPSMASARIQRWALALSAYDYSIYFKPGSLHANADVLSRRLPLPEEPMEVPLPGDGTVIREPTAISGDRDTNEDLGGQRSSALRSTGQGKAGLVRHGRNGDASLSMPKVRAQCAGRLPPVGQSRDHSPTRPLTSHGAAA